MARVRVTVVSAFRPGYLVGLEESYARAFEKAGHLVSRIPLPRAPESPRVGRQIFALTTALRRQEQLQVQVTTTDPDLILIIKGVGIAGRTVRVWKAAGAKVYNVFPDNPFDAAGIDLVGRTLFQQLRAVDLVFVHDRFAVGQLHQLGIRSEFIAFARDPDVHDPEKAGLQIPHEDPITFIGNPDHERIRYLRAVHDLGLGLWGSWNWAKLPFDDPLSRCIRGGVQLGVDMVRVARGAQICLNVFRSSQKTAHNMRTFEIPACGVCALSEDSIGAQELMAADRETVFFTSPEELRHKVIELLRSPRKIEEIAAEGWQRVRNDTYERRAAEIVAYL
jgi:spore maturation protein CgeB